MGRSWRSSRGSMSRRPTSTAPSFLDRPRRCNSWSKTRTKYPATDGWGFGKFPPQMEAFRQAAQRPAFQARAKLMFEIGFQRRSGVELRLGDYIERIATQSAKK